MLQLDIQLPRDRFDLAINTSLELDAVWGIMGASGCGKTSLLRAIAGLEKQVKGRIQCHDQVWMDSQQGIFVPPEQRGIGYIFQEARLFPHLSVLGNLRFSAKRSSPDRQGLSLAEVVDQSGIGHLLNRGIEALSGGEKQRVAIARTLLNAPQLLLMDEPLASLDWDSKATILPCLRNIHRDFNIPIIMVSHSREEVARLADRVLLLHQGSVTGKDQSQTLLNSALAVDDQHEPLLSTLEAEVVDHDKDYGLTVLSAEGYPLQVHEAGLALGTKVRMIVPAHEVSIVLDDFCETSVLNRLPVVIDLIQAMDDWHQLITLSLGEQKLMAMVTRKSVDRLPLKVGMKVFAHFKASGLEVV
ncbi:molybdenum ABC transporter ATP-binding protein [Endozoicomonas sp. 4G]|uniref:molybdenum ABC transporter ATP-binding protein n=1 Tax=Endozoicomonas sp. 4G TaxID=2872754 RepID=UPI0020788D36|nr:molybdenum ABC transporter ATP-binding protein [Endozoicomonas sp. 4G]